MASEEIRPDLPGDAEVESVEDNELRPSGDRPEDSLVVAGIGASAGGLEAMTELLRHLPPETEIALVFVQHLDPRHKSSLPEILARSAPLDVIEAADGMRLEPRRLYVIPADRDMTVSGGMLRLTLRPAAQPRHMPIDNFFRSLAEDFGNRAIGVVLSGTGSDGELGLRAIKAEGGITFAQDLATARYSGMPSHAAAVDVDLVLPPREIAAELGRLAHRPLPLVATRPLLEDREPETMGDLQKLFLLLRRASGVDFGQYKRSTVQRRIARRLLLHKLESLKQYLQYAQQTPGELKALFEDMLINVTNFFRDPETFEALKETVFPRC